MLLFYVLLAMPLALVLLLHLGLNSFGMTSWEAIQMKRGRWGAGARNALAPQACTLLAG